MVYVFPQEAFFGRDLLDTTKEKDMRSSSDSDEECGSASQVSEDKIIQLSQVGSMNSRILSLKTFLAWFIVRIVR
jgi:hypothetical protein